MKIGRIRVLNYKGFKDSEWIGFSPGWTVVVGKNNSGKSALLEAFRFQRTFSKPHRSKSVPRGGYVDPQSKISVDVKFAWREILRLAPVVGQPAILFPADEKFLDNTDRAKEWTEFTPVDPVVIELAINAPVVGQGTYEAVARRWPSHGQFPDRQRRSVLHIAFDASNDRWNSHGVVGNEENLFRVADLGLAKQTFVFSAERLNIDQSPPAANQTLLDNAQNLPTVLQELSTNRDRWRRFNEHISEVFPSITQISTPPPSDAGNAVTICVWQIDPETERDDLAIRLRDCGTGVGQVLAILYVAMTREDCVIVIDEPNSFLHPGASRALIDILKRYDKNQYVVSTHSPELIVAIEPDIIHRISWDGEQGQSVVEQIEGSRLDTMNALLSEVGARLADVFGADQIIWVEGPTEQECFPLIAHKSHNPPPSGTIFVAVNKTGDFDAKANPDQIWGIYKRLSEGAALLRPSVAFSFDREGRTDAQVVDMEQRSGGRVRFLSRRLLENYFLQSDAIAHVMAEEFKRWDLEAPPPDGPAIAAHLKEVADASNERDLEKLWDSDSNWLSKCHGADILSTLFQKHLLTYQKITHGKSITNWLLENDADHLTELSSYIRALWEI